VAVVVDAINCINKKFVKKPGRNRPGFLFFH